MGRLKDMATQKVVQEPPAPEVQPEVKPVSIEAVTPKPKAIKVKDVSGRRWWMMGGGVLLIIVGFVAFMNYAGNQNTLIGIVGVACIIGGGFVAWYGFKKQEAGMVVVSEGGKKVIGKKKADVKADCLNIYPDHISFEDMPDNEVGLPRKCHNDGKYYWVNIWDTAWSNPKPDGKLVPFSLPDTQYRDTKAFSLNLRIPAHRKLAQRKASLLEKLSPAVLLAAIVIVGIIWVATSPAPGG